VNRAVIEIPLSMAVGLVAFFALATAVIVINHSGYGVLVQFIWPLAINYMFIYSELSPRSIRRISTLMLAVWLISVAMSGSYSTTFFENAARSMRTEGYNPNTTAIVIASSCFFVEMGLTSAYRPRLTRLLLYVVSFMAIYVTRSRTSLISFAVTAVSGLLFRPLFKRSRGFSLTVALLIILVGTLFPIGYVIMFRNGLIAGDANVMGKSVFTGRQYIWMNMWEYLKANKGAFLWGTGYNIEFYGIGLFNVHNAYLQIFAQFGLPVLIIHLSYVLACVGRMFGRDGTLTDVQFTCYQVVLLTLLIGYTETIFSYMLTLLFGPVALGIGCREAVRRENT